MKLLKRNKAILLAVTLAPLVAACAHSRAHPEPVPEPPPKAAVEPVAPAPAPAPLDPKLQMPLPYTFSRHGVEVQVNYVEFVGGKPQVNVSIRETRNQENAILASTLMQALTDSGQTLLFTHYVRNGRSQTDPDISLKSNENQMLTLAFQPPAVSTSPTPSVILQFPTGKWWSSPHAP